jgi:hypothetical protein
MSEIWPKVPEGTDKMTLAQAKAMTGKRFRYKCAAEEDWVNAWLHERNGHTVVVVGIDHFEGPDDKNDPRYLEDEDLGLPWFIGQFEDCWTNTVFPWELEPIQ